MTQQRRDDKSTEFGLWLRQQKEIDSKLGFVASNIDYFWSNYKSGLWMLLEEKRYGRMLAYYQIQIYRTLDYSGWRHKLYKGFHILVFENTSPDDGGIWLDGRCISSADLIEFLQFAKSDDWYVSYFPQRETKAVFDA